MPENKTPERPKRLKMAGNKKKKTSAQILHPAGAAACNNYSTAAALCNIATNGFHDLIKRIKTRHAGRQTRPDEGEALQTPAAVRGGIPFNAWERFEDGYITAARDKGERVLTAVSLQWDRRGETERTEGEG